jgi:hypothetical protein
MSSEWSKEVEHSFEEIQIHVPSSTIQCHISRNMVNALYNPNVRANIMYASFACTFLGNKPIAPKNKTFRVAPRTRLEGLGILHNISLYHDNMEIILDFHVFDIQDFDILIGHPLEKLFAEPPKTRDMDIKLGRESFSIQVTKAKNSVAEPLLYPNLPLEVMSMKPFNSPESSLEKDAKLFKEDKDNLGETIYLPKEEVLT